jgi:ribosomal protein L40E
MRCSKCGSENPTGKKFCSNCGVGLLMRCRRCKADNPPTAKFCGECGASIGASIGALLGGTPIPAHVPTPEPVNRSQLARSWRDLAVLSTV